MFSPELHAVSSAEWYASFLTSQWHSYADTGPGPLEGKERREREGGGEGEGKRRRKGEREGRRE